MSMHPNTASNEAHSKANRERFIRNAAANGRKGGSVKGRGNASLHATCQKMLRRSGSISFEKYLKAEGYQVKSRMMQEQLVFRLFDSAIKEGNPTSMAGILMILSTGCNLQGGKNVPPTPPMFGEHSTSKLRYGQVRKIIVETARTWQKKNVEKRKPPSQKKPLYRRNSKEEKLPPLTT